MGEREREIRKLKKELEGIRLYSAGKYSTQYLIKLEGLIGWFYRWKYWGMVIDEGMQYLEIRKKTPYLEIRSETCLVFRYMMESCSVAGHRDQFYCTSAELASFIPRAIHNMKEFAIVNQCIDYCAR